MLIDAFSRSIRRGDAAGRILRAALLPTCLSRRSRRGPSAAARAQGADEPKAWNIESGVDASIKPGDDFFAYANGAWLKATEIPAGQGAVERPQRDRRAHAPTRRASCSTTRAPRRRDRTRARWPTFAPPT